MRVTLVDSLGFSAVHLVIVDGFHKSFFISTLPSAWNSIFTDERCSIMKPKTANNPLAFTSLLVLLVAMVGCNGPLADPPELSAELAMVVNNKEAFAQDPNDPLMGVIAGTIMDDLSTLDGCWGAASAVEVPLNVPDADIPPLPFVIPPSLGFETFTVHVFDREASTKNTQIFSQDALGILPLLTVISGNYTFSERNRLVLARTEWGFIDSVTGELVPGSIDENSTDRWLATLDGDRLLLESVSQGTDEDEATEDRLIFRKFDCP